MSGTRGIQWDVCHADNFDHTLQQSHSDKAQDSDPQGWESGLPDQASHLERLKCWLKRKKKLASTNDEEGHRAYQLWSQNQLEHWELLIFLKSFYKRNCEPAIRWSDHEVWENLSGARDRIQQDTAGAILTALWQLLLPHALSGLQTSRFRGSLTAYSDQLILLCLF